MPAFAFKSHTCISPWNCLAQKTSEKIGQAKNGVYLRGCRNLFSTLQFFSSIPISAGADKSFPSYSQHTSSSDGKASAWLQL